MRHRSSYLVPLALLAALPLAAAPVAAQTKAQVDSLPPLLRKRVEAILGIPRRTDEIRRGGVADSAVRDVIDVLIRDRVPAEEAHEIFSTESAAVRRSLGSASSDATTASSDRSGPVLAEGGRAGSSGGAASAR